MLVRDLQLRDLRLSTALMWESVSDRSSDHTEGGNGNGVGLMFASVTWDISLVLGSSC